MGSRIYGKEENDISVGSIGESLELDLMFFTCLDTYNKLMMKYES